MFSSALLLQALERHGLLDSGPREEAGRLEGRFPEAADLAAELVRREWLTAWQAERLIAGQGDDLVLGGYVLLEPLGEGGMGTVYLARQRALQRLAAVQLIRRDRLGSATAVERFLREARAAARLAHPHVVTIFDAGAAGGTHFLAMEYVPGVDLGRLVRESGPLPVAEACDYARQAALGLQHAHERQLVHRDIKPNNLLLTKAHGVPSVGVIKVLDFGLARHAGADADLTASGQVVGTPDYIAPEQALHSQSADGRSDIYSLGCSLYFLLTGQPPFAGASATEKILKRHLEDPPRVEDMRVDLPPELAAVLRKMMAKKPEDRYPTAAAAAAALQHFVDPGPVPATAEWPRPNVAAAPVSRPSLSSDLRPTSAMARPRPRRWLLPVACLALVLCGVTLAWRPFSASPVDSGIALVSTKEEGKPAVWLLQVIDKPVRAFPRLAGEIRCLAISQDGHKLAAAASGKEGGVSIWDVAAAKELYTFRGHPEGAVSVAFDADGKRVASTGKQDLVRVWHAATGKEDFTCAHVAGGQCVAFSRDGSRLASGGIADPVVRVWNGLTGELIVPAKGHTTGIQALAFSSDGLRLASGGGDHTVRIWDSATGQSLRTYDRHTDRVWGVAFSLDGRRIASTGHGGVAHVWDPTTGQEITTIHLGKVLAYGVAFSPDGRHLAIASAGEVSATICDAATGQRLIDIRGPSTPYCIAFHPDGKRIFTAGFGGIVWEWDVTSLADVPK